MDNGLLFPYRFYRDNGGTREGKLGVPNGHGAFLAEGDFGAGKSTPDVEGGGKWRGNPKRPSPSQAVKKSLVAVEVRAPVPQTDTGRQG